MSPLHASTNPLQHIHQLLTALPLAVKTRVCQECNWSLPTYYRKVKGAGLSNAEKEKIICILFDQLRQTWQCCKHGDNPPQA
ncbi:hypothetical protein F0L74_00310 [Chitinophaga agrisoli]|uniref:Uncharacterized protein n=1 Tax=Chitinophaga agrisoli TaxID=2607653 RepID=A0A5B2W129_9BACT|nr:hypothetical protein [Chitinophaga agrisoli]KAA2244460.1 hypothetical protein F0L74_00310 [Chitinophaga agrisoli]